MHEEGATGRNESLVTNQRLRKWRSIFALGAGRAKPLENTPVRWAPPHWTRPWGRLLDYAHGPSPSVRPGAYARARRGLGRP